MDYLNKEVDVTEKIEVAESENQMRVLGDLQLALVGGGCGEVVFG